jgi:hypothetical protein
MGYAKKTKHFACLLWLHMKLSHVNLLHPQRMYQYTETYFVLPKQYIRTYKYR